MSLFIPNINQKLIGSESYYKRCITYIYQNPGHKDFKSHDFSSYQSHLASKPTLLERDQVLSWFTGKEEFIKSHQDDRFSEREIQGFE